jgi:hypothetical protein
VSVEEELAADLICRGCSVTASGGKHLDECHVAPPEWGPRSEWPDGVVRWVCVSDCDVPTDPAPTPEELDRWQQRAKMGFGLSFISTVRLITALLASRAEVVELQDAIVERDEALAEVERLRRALRRAQDGPVSDDAMGGDL